MRLFAFDCFEGLPQGEGGVFEQGDFACSEDLFRRIIAKAGVDLERVRIVKGLFENTLNDETKKKHQLTKAAVVHCDADLYESTVEILAFVEDLIDVGTVLVFDDWYSYERTGSSGEFGERKAFGEWKLRRCFRDFYDFPGRVKAFVMTERP